MAALPDKVFIEKTDDGYSEYSVDKSVLLDLLYGSYASQNFIELFYSIPEFFAPINEIASRVADCNWQLCKDWNDEVDYSSAEFNRLFSQPNPLQNHKQLVYWQVVYEILTGGQFDFFNRPSTNMMNQDEPWKNISTWVNLPAHKVLGEKVKNVDPYTATEINDFISHWYTAKPTGGKRIFETKDVLPTLNLSLDYSFDVNKRVPLAQACEKPLMNLIPVYAARGVIYIKRGALGFIVSRKSDESGQQALTPGERKEAEADFQMGSGITQGKNPVQLTRLPVDFVRTSMSIQELQPFEETLADAVAIYKVLRVPRHFVPSKDLSTFANAESDTKAFYIDVIIPIAAKKAQSWTNYLKPNRRYIRENYDHIEVLQSDHKVEAEVNEIEGRVMFQRWKNGVCTLNDWITAIGGDPVKGDAIFEKKLPELLPEELERVKAYLNLSAKLEKEEKPKPNEDKKKVKQSVKIALQEFGISIEHLQKLVNVKN